MKTSTYGAASFGCYSEAAPIGFHHIDADAGFRMPDARIRGHETA